MTEVERMRTAFFDKTRRTVIVLYACLGLAAAGLAAYTLAADASTAAIGLGAGLVVAVLLFAGSPLLPVTARAARSTVLAAGVVAVVAAQILDVGDVGSEVFFLAASGGFVAGAVAGIAMIRRRLATDEELLLRQKRLGFDPENPGGFLRG